MYNSWQSGEADPGYRIIAGNSNFLVKNDGSLIATKATVTGEITATSGSIGSWAIYTATDDYGGNILASAFKMETAFYGVGLDSRSSMFNNSLNEGRGGRVFAVGQLGSSGAIDAAAAVNGTWENAALQIYADGTLQTTKGIFGQWKLSGGELYVTSDSTTVTLSSRGVTLKQSTTNASGNVTYSQKSVSWIQIFNACVGGDPTPPPLDTYNPSDPNDPVVSIK